MNSHDFTAPLFVPASRPERFAKAAASGADAVILDLEDAVRPEDKAGARNALITSFTRLPVIVRINGSGTPWHTADVDAALELRPSAIMLPKSEFSPGLQGLGEKAARRGIGIIALVETARGVAYAERIAAVPGVVRLAFGSVDYAGDIGCQHTRPALAHARAQIIIASRLAEKVAPIDGVTVELEDSSKILDDARYSRELGFGGKLCIHPRQTVPVLDCWKPTPTEIAWANRVVGTQGAVAIGGEMVDEPVRAKARAVLARAARQ